jgi:hypothetical protein
MNKYLAFLVLALATAACSLPARASVTQPPSPATVPPASGPTGSGTLRLHILSPMDGGVVNTPTVEIVGQTVAGAVVSIGDDILIANPDGTFKHIVSLQDGPNVIEILASDAQGNQTQIFFSIFYEP